MKTRNLRWTLGLLCALVVTPAFAQRTLRIADTTITRGSTGTVSVQLTATGTENAFGFSVTYDPALLTFVNATLGSGVAGASMNVNSSQAASGRVGIVLALPAGTTTAVGSRQLATLAFSASAGSSTSTQIGFGDQPIAREIADTTANVLSATYTAGTITLDGGSTEPPPPVIRKDVYLAIAGSVGVFRTDTRILNPHSSRSIQVNAYFLPAGLINNASVQPTPIIVPPRRMAVLDDVVAGTFHASGLGAVRLTSEDNFIATQRIYGVVERGTVGQYVPGIESKNAERSGVLIQLRTTGGPGQQGTYRTNIGAVNPNATATSITWKLYDRNNNVAATRTMQLPPYSVISPTGLIDGIFTNVTADLTDAWVAYSATQPVIAYASVLDNGTTDPLFVPMVEDTTTP